MMRVEIHQVGFGLVDTIPCKSDSGMPEFESELLRVANLRFLSSKEEWIQTTLTLIIGEVEYVKVEII